MALYKNINITKDFLDENTNSYFVFGDNLERWSYSPVFFEELDKLEKLIKKSPNKIFYISQLGGGLANKYNIWQKLIRHNLVNKLENFDNVVFCWTGNLI